MNFKRHRPKNQRAGCLFCKPHKANGQDRRTVQEMRRDSADFLDNGLRFSPHRPTHSL
jgi:hypothetical protein